MGEFVDADFDGPVSERELDALDAVWRPLGLVAAVIALDGARMFAAIDRTLEARDRWNAVRGQGYGFLDPYDDD